MSTRFVQPLLLRAVVRSGTWSLWNGAVNGHATTLEPGHSRYACISLDILSHCDFSVALDSQLAEAEL